MSYLPLLLDYIKSSMFAPVITAPPPTKPLHAGLIYLSAPLLPLDGGGAPAGGGAHRRTQSDGEEGRSDSAPTAPTAPGGTACVSSTDTPGDRVFSPCFQEQVSGEGSFLWPQAARPARHAN